MEELVGRLTALDPDASASLKVIVYFDSLVDGHAGLEAFLRGAAILAGCPAGVAYGAHGVHMRVDETGTRTPSPPAAAPAGTLSHPLGYEDGDARVWIERTGPAHANDAMILERMASGLRMTIERMESRLPSDNGVGVEVLLSADAAPGDRLRAAQRLHLDDTDAVRAVAVPPEDADAGHRELSTILPTVAGPVRAVLETRRGPRRASERAGFGEWGRLRDLPRSWNQAVTALRFTHEREPLVAWADLGPLAVLAAGVDALAAADPDAGIAEIVLIDRAAASIPWAVATLDALSSQDSVRAAAVLLNVHHSTMQSRCEQLEEALGYSLRTQTGRTRAALGLAIRRLRSLRFS